MDIRRIRGNARGEVIVNMCNVLALTASNQEMSEPQACKDSLIAVMPEPAVVTDITGGRLALLVKLEKYAKTVTEFILQG